MIKSHKITAVLLLLVVDMAWGATHYVKWDAAGTGDGSSWQNAYNTVQAGMNACTPGDTVEVSGGVSGHVYTELVETRASSCTVKGSLEAKHKGEVVLNGSAGGAPIFRTLYDGTVIENLTFTGSPDSSAISASGDNVVVRDCVIKNTQEGLSLQKNSLVERCLFQNIPSLEGALHFEGSSYLSTINYSQIINCGRGIHSWGSGTVVMNNSIISGSPSEGVFIGNLPGSVTLNNSVVIGSAAAYENKYSINNATGTCVANNSLLLANPWRPRSYSFNNVVQNNCKYELPKFNSGNFPGMISVGMDDANNFEDWKTIANAAEARGFRTFFGLSSPNALVANDYIELAEYLKRGHEVSGHGLTHSFLTETVAFTVSGPANSRVVINITRTDPKNSSTWSGTLDLRVGGVSIPGYPLDLGSDAFDSIGEVVAKINAESGWSSTRTANVQTKCNSLTLAAGNIGVGTGTNVPLEVAAYLHSEIFDCKKAIEDNLFNYAGYTYTVKSWVPAGNDRNDTSDAALQSYGFVASRGGGWIADYPETYKLAALNLYNIRTVSMGTVFGQDSSLVQNIASLLEGLKAIHGVGWIYSHGLDGSDSYPLNNWLSVFDVASASGIQVMTPSQIADYVTANADHTSANGRIYYRCATEDEVCLGSIYEGDYHLIETSPLIDTGIDIGLNQDFEGNFVPFGNKPDIGAYEYGSSRSRAMPWVPLLLLE